MTRPLNPQPHHTMLDRLRNNTWQALIGPEFESTLPPELNFSWEHPGFLTVVYDGNGADDICATPDHERGEDEGGSVPVQVTNEAQGYQETHVVNVAWTGHVMLDVFLYLSALKEGLDWHDDRRMEPKPKYDVEHLRTLVRYVAAISGATDELLDNWDAGPGDPMHTPLVNKYYPFKLSLEEACEQMFRWRSSLDKLLVEAEAEKTSELHDITISLTPSELETLTGSFEDLSTDDEAFELRNTLYDKAYVAAQDLES